MPDELCEAVFAAANRFFTLRADRSAAVSIARSGHNRGHVGRAVEAVDPDHKGNLQRRPRPSRLRPGCAGRPFHGSNLWPDLPGIREMLVACHASMLKTGVALHRAVAFDLGVPADQFDDKFCRPLATSRLLHYPARPAGIPNDDGNLTLLATDAVGRLELRRRDGAWIAAPPMPNSLICNVRDCPMRRTNDVHVSTPHRVVSRVGRARTSMAFFPDPDPDAVVAALPGCVPSGEASCHAPVTVAHHLRARLDAAYAR